MSEWVVLHCLMHLRQTRRYERQQRERIWDDDDDQPAGARRARRHSRLRRARPRRGAASSPRSAFRVAAWSAQRRRRAPGDRLFQRRRRARGDAGAHRHSRLPAAADRGDARHPQRALFAKLPRDGRLGGPILINAGRGGLQVEADIVAALETGALKGASLDVFETEPLPQDSPLWRHPAVFVTPHNAAISHPDAVARAIAEQILAHERGEPLRNVVDRARGY